MYRGFEFKDGLNTFVQKLLAVSKHGSFEVLFRGRGAATNCKNIIYLPEVPDDAVLHRSKLERYCGYILHEWSHIKYTGRVNIDNRHPNPAYLKQLWNAIEDGWIEQRTIDDNVVPNAARLLSTLVNGIYREALAANIDWNDPRQWPFALAVWSRRYLNIRPPVPADVAAIFDEAVSRHSDSTEYNLEIARWVYTKLRKYLKDNPASGKNDKPQKGEKQNKPEQGEAQSGQSQDGQSQGEDSQSKDSQGTGTGMGRSTSDLDKVDGTTAVEPTPDAHIESDAAREKRENQLFGADSLSENVLGERVAPAVEDKAEFAYRGAMYIPVPTPARLRYELNRLFDGSAREQYFNGKRSGQVNTGALFRHSFDDNVFRRRFEEDGIDTALYLLIDVSGSTGNAITRGGPAIYQGEFAAVHSIIDALRGTNVQIAIDAFADKIAQIADWGATMAKFKACHRHAYNNAGTSTEDLKAIRHAHRRLLARPEKRKVLMVFTDGLGHTEHVRRQCESALNLGITTIGVGIGIKVDNTYPQSVYINDLSELASVSLRQIQLAA